MRNRSGQTRSQSPLIEHADRVGKKIGISGGGRCNFTNTGTGPENFVSQNPHFCKSALARYTPSDFIALVEKHGIAYHEKKLGQLFCDGSSQQIIDMLLGECHEAGVEIRCGCEVRYCAGPEALLTRGLLQARSRSASNQSGNFPVLFPGDRYRRIINRASGRH